MQKVRVREEEEKMASFGGRKVKMASFHSPIQFAKDTIFSGVGS